MSKQVLTPVTRHRRMNPKKRNPIPSTPAKKETLTEKRKTNRRGITLKSEKGDKRTILREEEER